MTNGDECDLDLVPNRPQILNAIESLEPVFMEGYRRSRGLEMFANAWTLSMPPDEIAADKEVGRMIEHGGAWEWRTDPGSAAREVAGYFRYSGLLDLYMPTDIPDDTDAYCRDERRADWTASTAADDEYIESYARENTRADIESITESFEAIIEQCPTWRTKAVIRYVNRLAEGITDLIDTHGDNEIAAIEAIWENWKGEDATAAYEEFGIRIRSAPSALRQLIADMARAASEDGVEQACAMASLNNLVAKAHEGIVEATGYQPGYVETATEKFVSTVTVNRIPFLGDIIAAVDFIVTLTSEGKIEDGASRYVNAFMDKVWPNYGTAVTSSLCNEVRDDLIEGAGELLNELYDFRDKIAGDYLAQAAEDFGAMPLKDLVPGYRSGS